jgi:hypothetical protein
MQGLWGEDPQHRAFVMERAFHRAKRRGIGAAFDHPIPGDTDEPFMAMFSITDGAEWVDTVVMFPSLHVSDDRLTELDVEWVMERAVEKELLVHASRQLASLRSLVERRGCMVVIDRAFR